MRVLLLGGTGEARDLAARLQGRAGLDVVSSLAGRTADPRRPAGQVRVGGFGGTDGLAAFLTAEQIGRVVDASHPFAARITAQAVAAGAATGIPVLVLRRPGWAQQPGDQWHRVATIRQAAATAAAWRPGAVLLAVGRRDVAAFAADGTRLYVVRSVEPPDGPLPPRHVLVLARGPFRQDAEHALLARHRVIGLVSRDSGGAMTAAKLDAARALNLPAVLIDRPPLPGGVRTVTTVDGAISWLTGR